MLVIGLTGSIGMGKSTAAARFEKHGIPVFDADAVVHNLYSGKAAPLIEERFPGTTIDGQVDRERLGAQLMGDEKALTDLEAIVHPLVRQAREDFLTTHTRDGVDMVVLEIPLLFEVGADSQVDVTVVVTAPPAIQRERVLRRESMTEAKLDALLANQMPDEEKRRRADFVVDTSRPIEETGLEIDKLVESLRGRDGHASSTKSPGTADLSEPKG